VSKKWGLVIGAYAALALIFGGVTSSVNMPRFAKVRSFGRAAQATVSRTDCANHALVVASFEVSGVTYEARGTDGYQNPQCPTIKVGDRVLVFYLPSDPTVNVLGDVHWRWNNEVISVLGAMFVLPVIPAVAVWWRHVRRAR
jgi:hypothetical protein